MDLIDRRAAVDALNEYFARIGKFKKRGLTKGEKAISLDTVGAVKALPSAQPEIVRCKDCKYVGTDVTCCYVCNRDGIGLRPHHVYDDDFCSYAERRTDE